MGTRKVLLIEPSASGHHMTLYLLNVVRALVKEGVEIILLTTRRAVSDPAFDLVNRELPSNAKIFYFEISGGTSAPFARTLISSQVFNWSRLRRAAKKIVYNERPDVAYIPTFDWVAKATEVLGSPLGDLPFVVLYMTPKHHRYETGLAGRSRADFLYDRLFRRLLQFRSIEKVLVIDEIFYKFALDRYGRIGDKLAFAPDFGNVCPRKTRSHARRRLGIANDEIVLLVYGSLNLRKGIRELLSALKFIDPSSKLTVLLAGRETAYVKRILEMPEFSTLKRKRRVVTRLKFHTLEDEGEVFSASDAVWVAYVGNFFGSSGVFHQAIGFGLPVIASYAGLVGRLVERYQLGLTIDPEVPKEVLEALGRLINDQMSAAVSIDAFSEFRERHSAKAHVRSVLSALGVISSPGN